MRNRYTKIDFSRLFLLSKYNGDFKDLDLVGILFREIFVTIVENLRTTEGLSELGTYWIPYVQTRDINHCSISIQSPQNILLYLK